MPKNAKSEMSKEDIASHAVAMAADLGWENLRLQDVAENVGMRLADLSVHFDDKICILVAYGRYIDRRALQEAGDIDLSAAPRERLFDILMTRFDILNEQRAGVLSILKSFKTDPKQAIISLPHLGRSMTWMLEAAGIDTNGIRGALRVVGLKMIYLSALKSWAEDDSPDMPKVMASLDRALGQAESFVERFGL